MTNRNPETLQTRTSLSARNLKRLFKSIRRGRRQEIENRRLLQSIYDRLRPSKRPINTKMVVRHQ